MRRALLCFLFFLLLYGLTSHSEASASDEIAAFHTGVMLATRHNLIIDDIKSVQKTTPIGVYGRGDHLYSKYFPGTALTTTILYSLTARPGDAPYTAPNPTYNHVRLADSQTGAHVALAVNALLGALGLTMLLLLLESTYDFMPALVTTLLIGLTTDWWYESQLFYLEIGAGAFMIAALYFAWKRQPWAAAFCIAASVIFRPTNVVAIPIWLYAARERKWTALLSGMPIAAAAAFLALYNWTRFGSLLNFGYGGTGFTTPFPIGLAGLFLSPGHSFLLYSPILLLGFAGVPLLWGKDRGLAMVTCIGAGGYIVLSALWESWMGGKVWGSRLVVPAIPLIGLLVCAAVNHAWQTRNRALIAAIVALGAIGLAIQLVAIVQDPALALRAATQSGYATVDETTWSWAKSWLLLELGSLATWTPCNIGSFALRTLVAHCP